MFSDGPWTEVRLLSYFRRRRHSPFHLPLGSVSKNLLQKNIFIFYRSQIRQIILAHVNPTVRNLALSLPVSPSASQRPDLLDQGEQKGGCQPEQKHPVQRLQSTH